MPIHDLLLFLHCRGCGRVTRARLRTLLEENRDNAVSQASKMAKDLLEYEECLWTFARVDGVGPTNNKAERTLRKAVLWRKGSFGSASPDGSRFVERMLTICESLRAQGRSILDFLEESIRRRAQRTAPPVAPPCPRGLEKVGAPSCLGRTQLRPAG